MERMVCIVAMVDRKGVEGQAGRECEIAPEVRGGLGGGS